MASPQLQPSVLPKVAIMESCANCSFVFTSSSSRTKAVDLVIEASQSSGSGPSKVSVVDAFAFIQNLTREDDTVVPICSDCAPPLTRAYVEVKKLSQLRATDSYFAQQLRLREDLVGAAVGSKKGGKRKKVGKIKSPKIQAKKSIVSAKGKSSEASEKAGSDVKKARAKVVYDSLSSSNIINGPSSELSRPSRSAKLTAMVLMANTWDKEPIVFEEEKKPARTSLPASTTTKLNLSRAEEALGKSAGKVEKGSTKRKAPPAPTQTKKPKLEAETVTEDDEDVSWKLSKKKSKKATLVNVSKATSISPPSRSKSSKGQEKELSTSTKESDKRLIPEPVSVPKVEPIVLPKSKKNKKSGKVAEETAPAKIDIANAISKKDLKSDKKAKISKAKVLLPKVFKKLNTESATDRKKLKGSKMIVTDDPVGNSVTGSDQALDLTLKMSPTLSNDVQKSSKKIEKLKSIKPSKALNSVDTTGSVKSAVKKAPVSTELLSQTKTAKIKDKDKDKSKPKEPKKEDKIPVDDSKGKKFGCNSCDKTFSARWNLRRHELLVHELASSSPPFTCPNCSQVFELKPAFFEHRMSGPCATSIAASPVQNKVPVVSARPVIPQSKKQSHDTQKDVPRPPKETSDVKKAAKRKVLEKSPTPTKIPKDNAATGNSANSSLDTSSGSHKTKQDAINQLFDSVKAAAEAKNASKPEVPAVETSSTSGAQESKSKDAKSSDQSAATTESSEKSTSSVNNTSVNNTASSSAEGGGNASGPAENANGAGVGA